MNSCLKYYNPFFVQVRKQSLRVLSETTTVLSGGTRMLTGVFLTPNHPPPSTALPPSPFIKWAVIPEMTPKSQPLQHTVLPQTKVHYFTIGESCWTMQRKTPPILLEEKSFIMMLTHLPCHLSVRFQVSYLCPQQKSQTSSLSSLPCHSHLKIKNLDLLNLCLKLFHRGSWLLTE